MFHCVSSTLICSSCSRLKAEATVHMQIHFPLLRWTVHDLIPMSNFKTLLWHSLLNKEFRKFNQEESKGRFPGEHHTGSKVTRVNRTYFWGWICFFQDRVSLYSPGYPGTHSVDQSGLELINLPASASPVLELKVCATTARPNFFFVYYSAAICHLPSSRWGSASHPHPWTWPTAAHTAAAGPTSLLNPLTPSRHSLSSTSLLTLTSKEGLPSLEPAYSILLFLPSNFV